MKKMYQPPAMLFGMQRFFLGQRLIVSSYALKVLICQNEIPMDTTLAALRIAHAAGIKRQEAVSIHLLRSWPEHSIFNLAPAVADPPQEALTLPSIFCVNETEASLVSGIQVVDVEVTLLDCFSSTSMT